MIDGSISSYDCCIEDSGEYSVAQIVPYYRRMPLKILWPPAIGRLPSYHMADGMREVK